MFRSVGVCPDEAWFQQVASGLLECGRRLSALRPVSFCGLSTFAEGMRVLDMMSLDDTIEQKAKKNDVILRFIFEALFRVVS